MIEYDLAQAEWIKRARRVPTLDIRMGENTAIEAEMILEEALAEAETRMQFYRDRGEAGTKAALCCRERIERGRTALACLERARTEGREPLWPDFAA